MTILTSLITSILVAGLIVGFFRVDILNKFGKIPPSIIREIVKVETDQKIIEELEKIKNLSSRDSSRDPREEKIINLVKKTGGSVVNVIASKDLPVFEQSFVNPFEGTPNADFFKQFFPGFQVPQSRQKGTEKQQVSAGTGFIVSSDGLILTNKHVVSLDDVEYTVLNNKGEKFPAKVLARDPVQDLAIIKIEKNNLTSLVLGDSEKLEVGQTIIAIGNALGEFENSVSVGVISGLKRNISASGGGVTESLENIIQTDAAINQGNSGGPLLNLDGEVIGINAATVIGAQNIGFAIPINNAKKDIASVKVTGKISYPFLGVRYTILNKENSAKNNLSVEYGAWIRGNSSTEPAVTPGSPAEKAGLKENDIILEFDGIKITEENPLNKLVGKKSVGDTINLKVLKGGKEVTVKVILKERKN
ncbi:trypsin-like peptidase domain-containing protein [Candidatus Azambacteria bacterium]|nr:trypsin-like peptidase domain-containing protein [Candidatus Azambacteria bacterium]